MNKRRTLFGIFDLVLLLALASALVSTQPGDANELAVEAAEAKRLVHRLSDLLRQSTDDLTRMVRLYAVTGELQYREYYEEILAIRNGEAAQPEDYEEDDNYWDSVLATGGQRPGDFGPAQSLRSLLRDPEFTNSELAVLPEAEMLLLEESEDLSINLATLEEASEARIEEEVARRLAQHRQLRELQMALAVMLERRGRRAGDSYGQGESGLVETLVTDLGTETGETGRICSRPRKRA